MKTKHAAKSEVIPQLLPWQRRGVLIGAAVILLAVVVIAYAGDNWAIVVYRLLADGMLAAVWLSAAVGIGALLIWNLKFEVSNVLRLVTSAALGLGILSLLTLFLGLAGWLNRATTIALIVVGLACCVTHVLRTVRSRERQKEELVSSWNCLWLIVIPFAGIAVVAAFVPPGILWGADDPAGYDVVEYHLQVPREWYEAGRIAPLHHNVFSYFPFNVEMHYLLAMHLRGGPWAGMYLAQLMHLSFVALTVVAIYGIARQISPTPGGAVVAAVAAASAPWLTMLGGVAYNEGGLLLFGTLAIGWAMLAMKAVEDSPQRTHMMLVAGAMAGFACGVKLTAAPVLLVALPWILLIIERARGRNGRATLRAGRWYLIACMLLFAPWLLRNQAWTGNPVFPEGMAAMGRAHFDDVQVERWQRAHAPREDQRSLGSRLEAGWHQVVADWRYAFMLLPLAIVSAILNFRRSETWLLFSLLVVLVVFWLGFTHLQSRFFVLAIPICALLIAMLDPRWLAPVVAVACVAGMVNLHPRFEKLSGVLGTENLAGIYPDDVTQATQDASLVVLVGDAKAFWYQIPMSRLRYRTVFDVPAGNDAMEAWIGGDAPERATIIVDPTELQRFSRTYWRIPPLSDDMRGPRDQPFVLRDRTN